MKEIIEENSQKPERETPPKTPRWVKVSGIIAIVLVLLIVSIHLYEGHGTTGPMNNISNMNGMKM